MTSERTPERADLVRRLACVEGQVRGLARMVASDAYCIETLTQVSAVTAALRAVALDLLTRHMSTCLLDAARLGGPEQEAKVKEASDAIARLVRS
ncbi:metal-sensitive transcriptional regulator [Actinotalea sp.]|uniref:metal-sensitive transcriptional regulator n=1 Tax=Actinotalea sp. TaxID=1872145 RepID=UPI0035646F13